MLRVCIALAGKSSAFCSVMLQTIVSILEQSDPEGQHIVVTRPVLLTAVHFESLGQQNVGGKPAPHSLTVVSPWHGVVVRLLNWKPAATIERPRTSRDKDTRRMDSIGHKGDPDLVQRLAIAWMKSNNNQKRETVRMGRWKESSGGRG